MTQRRTHSPGFKARVAMEVISGRRTIQAIAADRAIHLADSEATAAAVRQADSDLLLHLAAESHVDR